MKRAPDNAPVNDLDFFADLMTTGTVLGLDHTSTLAEVEEVLGAGQTFEAPSGVISDYDLVEFGWSRDRPQDEWAVVYFGAQTHRLPWLVGENELKGVLVDRYGPFRPRLDLDDLRDVVRARGFELHERPSWNEGCVEYWEPTSRMGLVAVSDPGEEWDEPAGMVLKMLGPGGRRYPWAFFRGREQRFESYAHHLLTLAEPELAAWLDRREPAEECPRTEWWACLRNVVMRRTGGNPGDYLRWRRLGVVLDRYAGERGVDAEDEAAVNLITALVEVPGLREADGLPALDEAVERWLAATAPLADAVRLCGEWPLDPACVRTSRRLRNQIHDVQPCLPFVTSPVLADELRRRAGLRRSLLRPPASQEAG